MLELDCTECCETFNSATALLQHFARHAAEQKKTLPGLYRISLLKKEEDGDERDSGVEDVRELQTFPGEETFALSENPQQYTAVHGEKIFGCSLCSHSFTRRSLLQKHQLKHHKGKELPSLVPVAFRKARKQEKGKIKRKMSDDAKI